MGVPRFMLQLFRQAPDKRQLVRSLALGNRGGDRTISSADGTDISVRRTGEGRPPLVLVHGALDGIGAFSLVELRLAEHYDVWVYDRRGRGGSGDGDEYSLEREVDDLRAVIAETGDLPHVVAHSFGALIALQAARAGTEMRSLTLYEPPTNAATIPPQRVAELRRAVAEGRTDDAIRDMALHLAGLEEDQLAIAMAVPPIRKTLRAGAQVVTREVEAVREWVWSGPALTEPPILMIGGERSVAEVYPNEEQAREIAPDATIATLEGQGHLGHVFAPTDFTTTVLAFLDQH